MKRWKKYTGTLMALVLCVGLTACGGNSNDLDNSAAGNDWRVTGGVRDRGTITRDGEDTAVLVCVNASKATFYYDKEEQVMFDSVEYPLTLESDAGEAFQSIDFADLNDDGNSDVTMKFNDGGSELLMVWFWDTESNRFAYQPDKSQLGEEDEGRGDLITDDGDEGRGDKISDDGDEGRGDKISDDDNEVLVLMSGALPFTNMETLKSENHKDGTYYYADLTEDGMTTVVNTALKNHMDDAQTTEEYLTDCALDLGESDSFQLQTVEQNDAYTKKMSYPVYVVTYTAGENEDTREWIVFAMNTDSHTYLYGFGTMLDAADDMNSIYQDVFAGLHLSEGEN